MMGSTYGWCLDKTKLDICDKHVFFVNRFGNKHWYLNDKRHRENGPAVEYASGTVEWWLNGLLHREDGPAIEYANGYKDWYLYGEIYSESDYWKELKK